MPKYVIERNFVEQASYRPPSWPRCPAGPALRCAVSARECSGWKAT